MEDGFTGFYDVSECFQRNIYCKGFSWEWGGVGGGGRWMGGEGLFPRFAVGTCFLIFSSLLGTHVSMIQVVLYGTYRVVCFLM